MVKDSDQLKLLLLLLLELQDMLKKLEEEVEDMVEEAACKELVLSRECKEEVESATMQW
jgi:hypothetical protein